MSSPRGLAVIVEGHGEVQAVPVLLRRLLPPDSIGPLAVLTPHRIPKSKMRWELERAVIVQSGRAGPLGGVLVLVDADDDPAPTLASRLHESVPAHLRPSTRVVVAVKEYEAWFLAGIRSLRGHRSVRDDAEFVGDPELPLDAKGRLQGQMTEKYQETIHQAAFSAIVDLDAVAAQAPSFVALRQAVADVAGNP